MLSRLFNGSDSIKSIRRFSVTAVAKKTRAFSSSLPSNAAGSGTPQWALIGWPGHTGQVSLAALSHTVKTKSRCGAPACANSP